MSRSARKKIMRHVRRVKIPEGQFGHFHRKKSSAKWRGDRLTLTTSFKYDIVQDLGEAIDSFHVGAADGYLEDESNTVHVQMGPTKRYRGQNLPLFCHMYPDTNTFDIPKQPCRFKSARCCARCV